MTTRILSLLILLGCAVPAQADESATELEEVVVLASRSHRRFEAANQDDLSVS
mgnify:CR=1 FL=1